MALFGSGKRSAKMQQILAEYDLIESSLETAVRTRRLSNDGELVFEPKPSSYQIVLDFGGLAESLLTESTLDLVLLK